MDVLDSARPRTMKRVRYCGGPSIGLHKWLLPTCSSNNIVSTHEQFRNRRVIGTYSGRSAIALACKLLGIGPGDEVLVPAYNCGTEIDAIIYTGAKTIGYQVSRRCEIDLADLFARKTKHTKVVYVISYFGWEPPLAELRRWCDEQGLFLIEDCALALFSRGETGLIGQLGDATIYSLPKTLGSIHGGLLSLPESNRCIIPDLILAARATLLSEILNSTKATLFRKLDQLRLYGPLQSILGQFKHSDAETENERPDMPASYYFAPQIHADRACHPLAARVGSSIDWQAIVHQRRQNYLQLFNALTESGNVTPLYQNLPEGVCPLSLPLLVSNRDACVAKLQAKGISAYPWWAGFHRSAIDWSQFPDACWLKRHLLTLPVHQGLKAHHISYMTKTLTNDINIAPFSLSGISSA
jgi:dTDP-4-amino-4,6-dideoxygalactose transaminase